MKLEELVPETLIELLGSLSKRVGYLPVAHQELVAEALCVAIAAHGEHRRKDGSLYVTHLLKAACLVALCRSDVEVVQAALLHDTLEDTALTRETLRDQFGEDVTRLVESVTHHGAFSLREYFEKIRSRSIDDPRIATLKIADRCSNLMHHGQDVISIAKHREQLDETKTYITSQLAPLPGVPHELVRTLERVVEVSEEEYRARTR